MSDFQTLKNRVILASFASTGLGVLLLFTPAKAVSNWVIAGSIGFLVAGNAIVDKAEKLHDKQAKKNNFQLQKLDTELANNHQLLSAKVQELASIKAELVISYTDNHQITQNALQLKATISKLQGELMTAKNQLSEAKDINSSTAVEILQDSFVEFKSQISALTTMLAKKYPDLSNDWALVEVEYQKQATELTNQIRVVSDQSESQELISMALAVQYEILYRGSMLKVKAYKSVVTHLAQQLIDVMPIDEHSAAIEELNQTWQAKTQAVKQEYHQYFEAIKAEFSEVADTVTTAYREDFNSIISEGMSQSEQIEALQLELHRLTRKLEELSKPHRFPGLTEQARVGNAIIDYYQRLGYCLDAIDWVSNETGYKLLFHHTRNGSRFISTDLLNDGDLPEKLKEVSASLNTPKFEQSERGGHVVLEVQTRHKRKSSSADDIARLWTPASQFEKTVKDWSRVRITGGSESGKSPTAENLAVCILKTRPGTAKLFNPQHDSVKNYWTIPVVGTSHNESEKGISTLAKLVDLRSTGKESREQFEVWIFDEIDSTMSHTHGKKSVIGGNVNFIIKQASHQNLGAIFIGQNANVSEYPGMDRSDWNNAVNVHIGANAYDAITNSNRFTSEEQAKLKATTDKLTEFCTGKNEELGLDKTNPNAYRFALVLEPNKKPYFVELPRFGCYTYDQITPVNTLVAGNDASNNASNSQSLEPLQSKDIAVAVAGDRGVMCAGCGSTNIKRNGKIAGKQKYQCKDCKTNWSE
ncbi:hypothetical protein Cylst_6381 (plasmid) [Cylindrospermum stagnale PCC 7417]|uniref:Uncharacterized protein n=1 Tax=Cylindrospermum stagnale PCC 7417 TaxID=56107 RepID=K9X930_9NOST|nr:hypothetical protein [Cylindrospermum stagnale]AFZ28599.1 hypothetical protein Cylst_6381 [Cylindrospermum stagnale PCC 7417]